MDASRKDYFQEIFNIGMGRAAQTVSELVGAPVTLSVPHVAAVADHDFESQFSGFGKEDLATVTMSFSGMISGNATLVLSPFGSKIISAMVLKKASLEGMEIGREEIIEELGNIILNRVIGSWSELLCDNFSFAPPEFAEIPLSLILETCQGHAGQSRESDVIMGDAQFLIQDFFVSGAVIIIFDNSSVALLAGE